MSLNPVCFLCRYLQTHLITKERTFVWFLQVVHRFYERFENHQNSGFVEIDVFFLFIVVNLLSFCFTMLYD